MRNYFTSYEYRLEIAGRHPVIVRLLLSTVICLAVMGLPLLFLSRKWSEWLIATGSLVALCNLIALVLYFRIERR